MNISSNRRPRLRTLAGCAVLAALPLGVHAQAVLSNNLSNASGGTETASGATYFTSSFGTDASAYTLNSVSLLLDNSAAGTAEVDIFSDATDYQGSSGLQPGTLIGTLSSPTSYSSTLAPATFTASGISLAANSTYWVVLKANSGAFDWSYTNNDTGSGSGFQDTFGESDDAGATWTTYGSGPTQMSVLATPAAVPEASTALSLGLPLSLLGLGVFFRMNKKRSNA